MVIVPFCSDVLLSNPSNTIVAASSEAFSNTKLLALSFAVTVNVLPEALIAVSCVALTFTSFMITFAPA